MTKKQVSVIVDYRTLAMSLMMASEQLEKVTNLPKVTWVDYLTHAAKKLVLNKPELIEEIMSDLKAAEIYESDLMNVLFSIPEKE